MSGKDIDDMTFENFKLFGQSRHWKTLSGEETCQEFEPWHDILYNVAFWYV